jgi:hypothetical protein
MKFKRRYKIKAIALKKEVLVPFVEELEAGSFFRDSGIEPF